MKGVYNYITKEVYFTGVVFNHHSVFPVHFDSTVIRFWHDCALKINIFERKSGQKSVSMIYLSRKLHQRYLTKSGFADMLQND